MYDAPYSDGDLNYMNLHVIPDEFCDEVIYNSQEVRTFFAHDAPIAIVGITLMYPGVASVWSISSEEASNHAFYVVRRTRELIKYSMEQYNIHRIQTSIDATDYRLIKWIELVGLAGESVMHAAAPDGGDLLMYAKLRGN